MKLKRILGILMSLMLLLLSGCGGGSGTDKELVSLKLSITKASVEQNSYFTFPTAKAIYNNSEEADVTVNWAPSKPDTSVIGTTMYTATYAENGVTVNATFQLTVTGTKNLAGLTLAKTTDIVALKGSYVLPVTGTAIYDDSTTETVNLTWDKEVITTVVGTTIYTATYTENNKTVAATFSLTVKNIILTNLSLESTKGSVKIGNVFTLPATGTATYDDGTTKTVNIIWTVTPDTSEIGIKDYTGTYTENEITKLVTYTLTVTEKDPKIKELKFSPSTVIVAKNQTVVLPTTATAIYEDETTKTVNVTWITGTNVDTSKTGTQICVASYTYSYEGSNLTVYGTYTAIVTDVKTPSTLTLKQTTASTEINSSYTLPTTATVTYDDNTTAVVTVKWDRAADTSAVGTNAYIATYTENNKTVTAYFILTVTNKVSLFTITKTSDIIELGTLYTLPTTGTITYADGTTENVAVTWNMLVNTSIVGTTTYTGTSTKTDKTVSFALTVTAPNNGTGELQLADATALNLGDDVSVVISANSFTKTALSAEMTITYDVAALQYSSITLLGDVAAAAKLVTTGNGNVTLKITPTTATQLSGQIAKITFKTLKSGNSTVKIGSASIVDNSGAAYIDTTITDTATVTVGSTEVSNKIEISDAAGKTNGEVEITLSASKFTKTAMGVDIILNYDTNYLDVARDSSGNVSSDIVTPINSNFMGNLMIVKEAGTGKIQVALISMSGNTVDINGNLFKIKFKTKTTVGSTTVSLGEVVIADSVSSYITEINAADTATVTIDKIETTDPIFEISDVTATAGSYVNVQLIGKNFKNEIGGVEFNLEYDSSYLTIESENDITFTNNLAVSGAMKIVNLSSGKAVIVATVPSNFDTNGSIVNIKFKAGSNKGTTIVKLSKVETADVTATAAQTIAVEDTGNITIN